MRKYGFIIGGIIVLLLVFYFIDKSSDNFMTEHDFTEKNFDKDDSLILKKEVLSKIKVVSVIKSKTRNPLKFYKYKKSIIFIVQELI